MNPVRDALMFVLQVIRDKQPDAYISRAADRHMEALKSEALRAQVSAPPVPDPPTATTPPNAKK